MYGYDKKEALEEVREDPLNLEYLSNTRRADVEVVFEAVSRNPDARQYALLDDAGFAELDQRLTAAKASPAVTLNSPTHEGGINAPYSGIQ